MFTGLVEAVGEVRSVLRQGHGITADVALAWPDGETPRRGDSIAVNGACLTAVTADEAGFAAQLSPETLARTLLAELRPGDRVNIERALRLGDRLGGHLVQGHVDGVVSLIAVTPQGDYSRWRLSLPTALTGEVARKGSVCVHGVSLTVADLGHDWFEVALILATLAATNLEHARVGARLHLETDVLAKYVSRAGASSSRSPLDELFGQGASGA
jgi:riboflavin synthase